MPLTALVGLMLLLTGGAQAAAYANAAGHYHFTAPDGWDQTNGSGGNDVTFETGVVYFGGAMLSATHQNNTSAANTEAYLLEMAQQSHAQMKGMVGGTDVQAPRTFTTGAGRLAGEFVLDYTIMSISTRVRQVFFASDGYDMVYVLAMTAAPSDFQNQSSNWTMVVDSWGIDNEPAGNNGGNGGTGNSQPGFEVVGVVAAIAVVALVATRRRR
jgi:PGF-CTERM protein